jgi:hypothetical protein
MTITRYAFTSALKSMGVAEVFTGDWTVAGGMTSLGAIQGAITENIAWLENALLAEEHTGEVPHEMTYRLGAVSVTVPLIIGDNSAWAKISPTGSKDAGSDSPIDAVTTGIFIIPRKEITASGIGFNGSVWTPTAPVNSLFMPRGTLSYGEVPRPFEQGGKAIVPVTIRPMFYAAGPTDKKVFVRGDPFAAGYTTFRL